MIMPCISLKSNTIYWKSMAANKIRKLYPFSLFTKGNNTQILIFTYMYLFHKVFDLWCCNVIYTELKLCTKTHEHEVINLLFQEARCCTTLQDRGSHKVSRIQEFIVSQCSCWSLQGTPLANNLPFVSLRTSKNIGNHCLNWLIW